MVNDAGDFSAQYSMNFRERQAVKSLIIDSDQRLREVVRNAIQSLGYGNVYCVNDHSSGLMKLDEEDSGFTHVFYQAKSSNIDVLSFLESAFDINYRLVFIAICEDPQVDEIFGHLQRGARGFITRPVSADMIEQSILQATLGERFSETILNASDRNEAFSALLAATVRKAAAARRIALQFPGASKEAGRYMSDLEAASHLVRTFWKGGETQFLETMVEFFVSLSEAPATKLGHLRKRLSDERRHADELAEGRNSNSVR